MPNGKILHTDPSGDFVVNNAVSDGSHYGEEYDA
jgi:hypothetical protein